MGEPGSLRSYREFGCSFARRLRTKHTTLLEPQDATNLTGGMSCTCSETRFGGRDGGGAFRSVERRQVQVVNYDRQQADWDSKCMIQAKSKTNKRTCFPEWGVALVVPYMAMASGRAIRAREKNLAEAIATREIKAKAQQGLHKAVAQFMG